jgi:uncharacterized OB-fold protein
MTFVHSSIDIGFPYTHSTGPIVGRALAAFADKRLLGARCTSCAKVNVPAREWCELCGGSTRELVEIGPGGTVRAAARVHEPNALAPMDDGFSWVLVRLDGADTNLVHLARGDVAAGTRVHPVWRAGRAGSITDIETFEPGEPATMERIETAEPPLIFAHKVSLPYTLSAGTLMSRFYDDIRERKQISAVRCTNCGVVIVPPSVACQRCWADTEGWIALPDHGIVTTFVVVNVPFHGQQMPLPYVLARILLDGADTSFLHLLGGVDARDARMGMRVEAVWRAERAGFLNDDVEYFRPTGEPDAPLASFIDRL